MSGVGNFFRPRALWTKPFERPHYFNMKFKEIVLKKLLRVPYSGLRRAGLCPPLFYVQCLKPKVQVHTTAYNSKVFLYIKVVPSHNPEHFGPEFWSQVRVSQAARIPGEAKNDVMKLSKRSFVNLIKAQFATFKIFLKRTIIWLRLFWPGQFR